MKKQSCKKSEAEKPQIGTSPQEGQLNIDIDKLQTIEGQGRVTVAADEWIRLMEFVQ